MPESNTKVAAYAAGASIVAATLAYIFGPSLWDFGPRTRKKGIVGIRNPGNDCFINSVLQALASSEALRNFLAEQLELRHDASLWEAVDDEKPEEEEVSTRSARRKAPGLREGWITASLRDVLETLNDRPQYQKNISNIRFVQSLEHAFRTRISRRQQDAQEFLQIVAERVFDEHEALMKLLKQMRITSNRDSATSNQDNEDKSPTSSAKSADKSPNSDDLPPFSGQLESQVECLTCHFKPKPSVSTFVCLTLNVPQRRSTTLDDCLDGVFKQEIIDDYVCDKCRLEHAISTLTTSLDAQTTPDDPVKPSDTQKQIDILRQTLATDPETPPPNITLPDRANAPRRKISKHTCIRKYPKLLTVHLSRSIFDYQGTALTKNTANVAFGEDLTLGAFDERQTYKLNCLITHIGGHHSGHYETFRRQHVDDPPDASAQPNGPASRKSSVSASLHASAAPDTPGLAESGPSDASQAPQVLTDSEADRRARARQVQRDEATRIREVRRRAKLEKKWWRISDDRVGQCVVGDVLNMKREAYILMYERVEDEDSTGA